MKIHAVLMFPIMIVMTFVAILLAVIIVTDSNAYAQERTDQQVHEDTKQDDDKKDTSESEKPEASDQKNDSNVTYRYVAQPNDSYSEIARKAVQTYGLKNDIKLSQAQIMFAETNLTQQAGSPYLIVGQNIEIPEMTVSEWVERAEALSDKVETMWVPYTQGVDFNTDNIGESANSN